MVTKKELIHKYVLNYINEHGKQPRIKEIAEAVGANPFYVKDCIQVFNRTDMLVADSVKPVRLPGPKRRRIQTFIKGYVNVHGRRPRNTYVADNLGVSEIWVKVCLRDLKRTDSIVREAAKPE